MFEPLDVLTAVEREAATAYDVATREHQDATMQAHLLGVDTGATFLGGTWIERRTDERQAAQETFRATAVHKEETRETLAGIRVELTQATQQHDREQYERGVIAVPHMSLVSEPH
ncbi:hypothetical protein [Streptomyces sp. AcH 505]|uniref:hypothetical protein n=1 Tax=Streptomyces sp. AcH 505 TaxID=352211 RepID=UPI0012FF3AA3